MQILSNAFPIDWSTVQSPDFLVCLSRTELLYLINQNPAFVDEMILRMQDFLKREDHMKNRVEIR